MLVHVVADITEETVRLHTRLERVPATARCTQAVVLAVENHLFTYLFRHRAAFALAATQVLRRIHVTTEMRAHLAPPIGQHVIVVARTDGPVALRSHVVDSLLVKPRQRVGVDTVVLPIRTHRTRLYAIDGSRGVGLACDASRTDAEMYVRTHGANSVMHHTNHLVDLRTTPIGTAHAAAGSLIVRIVIRVLVARLVEIVVKDYAIHIVVLHQVSHHRRNTRLHFRQTRVEDVVTAAVDEPLGMRVRVVGRQRSVGLVRGAVAIRVHPRMHLDTLAMRILHKHSQRIVRRLTAARACQILAPGLVSRVVHRVTKTAHLEEHGVHPRCLQRINQCLQFLLLLAAFVYITPRRRPIDRPHRSQPRSAELTLGLRLQH